MKRKSSFTLDFYIGLSIMLICFGTYSMIYDDIYTGYDGNDIFIGGSYLVLAIAYRAANNLIQTQRRYIKTLEKRLDITDNE